MIYGYTVRKHISRNNLESKAIATQRFLTIITDDNILT